MADETTANGQGANMPSPENGNPDSRPQTGSESVNAALAEKARKLEIQLAHAMRKVESYQKAVERYASAQLALCEIIGELHARNAAQV